MPKNPKGNSSNNNRQNASAHKAGKNDGIRKIIRKKDTQLAIRAYGNQGTRDKPLVIMPELNMPYNQEWPVLGSNEGRVFTELQSTMKEKISDPSKVRLQRILQKKPIEEITNMNDRRLLDERFYSHSQDIVIGINQVTKALEKDSQKFRLVMACTSVMNPMMTKHILTLSLVRGVNVCGLPGMSEALAPILGLKSVLTIAFKDTESSPFHDLVDFIVDKIPEQSERTAAWMDLWSRQVDPQDMQISGYKAEEDRMVRDILHMDGIEMDQSTGQTANNTANSTANNTANNTANTTSNINSNPNSSTTQENPIKNNNFAEFTQQRNADAPCGSSSTTTQNDNGSSALATPSNTSATDSSSATSSSTTSAGSSLSSARVSHLQRRMARLQKAVSAGKQKKSGLLKMNIKWKELVLKKKITKDGTVTNYFQPS